MCLMDLQPPCLPDSVQQPLRTGQCRMNLPAPSSFETLANPPTPSVNHQATDWSRTVQISTTLMGQIAVQSMLRSTGAEL